MPGSTTSKPLLAVKQMGLNLGPTIIEQKSGKKGRVIEQIVNTKERRNIEGQANFDRIFNLILFSMFLLKPF